jgi:hypothetical protein
MAETPEGQKALEDGAKGAETEPKKGSKKTKDK